MGKVTFIGEKKEVMKRAGYVMDALNRDYLVSIQMGCEKGMFRVCVGFVVL